MSRSSLDEPQVDRFDARRSGRISSDFLQSDGDTWQENLTVCEVAGNKLLMKSYYVNTRNGKRVWDEPPSGASHVIPASDHMRAMATAQMQEMQLILASLPDSKDPQGRKKKRFFWRKKKRGGRFFGRGSKEEIHGTDEAVDHALLQAIALSMEESGGHEFVSCPGTAWQDEEEELAMAKALSLSASYNPVENENDTLRQAIEQSRHESGVASMPSLQSSSDSQSVDSTPEGSETRNCPSTEDLWGRKMPAQPMEEVTSDRGLRPNHSGKEAPRRGKTTRRGVKKPPPATEKQMPSLSTGKQREKTETSTSFSKARSRREFLSDLSGSKSSVAAETEKIAHKQDPPIRISRAFSNFPDAGKYSPPSSPVAVSSASSSLTGSPRLFYPCEKDLNLPTATSGDSNDSSMWTTDSEVEVEVGLRKKHTVNHRRKPGRSFGRNLPSPRPTEKSAGLT